MTPICGRLALELWILLVRCDTEFTSCRHLSLCPEITPCAYLIEFTTLIPYNNSCGYYCYTNQSASMNVTVD